MIFILSIFYSRKTVFCKFTIGRFTIENSKWIHIEAATRIVSAKWDVNRLAGWRIKCFVNISALPIPFYGSHITPLLETIYPSIYQLHSVSYFGSNGIQISLHAVSTLFHATGTLLLNWFVIHVRKVCWKGMKKGVRGYVWVELFAFTPFVSLIDNLWNFWLERTSRRLRSVMD